MVEVSDIVDRESLKAWLNARPIGTRQADAVAIACRAAMRVMPLFVSELGSEWARKVDLTGLPVLRSLLTAGVARTYPTPAVKAAAASTSSSATSSAFSAAYASDSYASAFSAAYASGSYAAAYAAAAASDSAASDSGAAASDSAAAAYAAAVDSDTTWAQLRNDAGMIAAGQDPLCSALWLDSPPDWAKSEWETAQRWLDDTPGHPFWLRWYEAVVEGRPLTGDWDSHWKMLRDIALIPNDDWQQGAEHLAGLIAEIEKPFALAMTASNERVVISEQTGLLKLEPVVPLAQDFDRYIRRKLGKALRVFGDHPGNQYTAVLPELGLVREAVEDAENLPVELYDTCTSVTTRVAARVKDGALPPEDKDALIADFLKHIREAGAEIFAEDEETRKAVERRRAIEPNDALIEHGDAIWAVVNKISGVSESGPLEQLSQAANQALDPSVSTEGRHIVSFKLVGRVIAVLTTVGAAGLAFPPAVQSAIESYRWLATDPQVQIAWQAILRYLGLA